MLDWAFRPARACLRGGRVAEFEHEVDAARPNQRRIETRQVIGGHEDEALLGRGDAVDRVQQAGKGEARERVAGVALHERRVHVLAIRTVKAKRNETDMCTVKN